MTSDCISHPHGHFELLLVVEHNFFFPRPKVG